MEQSKLLFIGKEEDGDVIEEGFLHKCLAVKINSIDSATITQKCNEYAKLLGILDFIWSSVRGVQGLLPTEEDVATLSRDVLLLQMVAALKAIC